MWLKYSRRKNNTKKFIESDYAIRADSLAFHFWSFKWSLFELKRKMQEREVCGSYLSILVNLRQFQGSQITFHQFQVIFIQSDSLRSNFAADDYSPSSSFTERRGVWIWRGRTRTASCSTIRVSLIPDALTSKSACTNSSDQVRKICMKISYHIILARLHDLQPENQQLRHHEPQQQRQLFHPFL